MTSGDSNRHGERPTKRWIAWVCSHGAMYLRVPLGYSLHPGPLKWHAIRHSSLEPTLTACQIRFVPQCNTMATTCLVA